MTAIFGKRERSMGNGELRAKDIGSEVVLMGWVQSQRDLGGFIFVDLRDRTGIVQLVFKPEVSKGLVDEASRLRQEHVIAIRGSVESRGANVKRDLGTGEVEVVVKELEVLSQSKPLPFPIAETCDATEATRLKFRYLDLRRPPLARAIRKRSDALQSVRGSLVRQGFIEVETPILTRSTPEGARDFLVPSRIQTGEFYALPQSPQLFKQLLMVAGMERYFQVCRCFRDEDLRADRQPEFTQIDIEMSFITRDDILRVAETLLKDLFREAKGLAIETPFRRITYADAMGRYGADNPDLRFGLEIADLTEIAGSCEFKIFREAAEKGGRVAGITLKSRQPSRKTIDQWTEAAKEAGAKGLAWMRLEPNGDLGGPVAKFLVGSLKDDFVKALGLEPGDTALIVADADRHVASIALGRLRRFLGRELNLIPEGTFAFVWVVDFPLFERDKVENRWTSVHHPFTSPHPEDIGLLAADPGRVRAMAYDVVLNGHEVGGGSIRIHDPGLQKEIFRILNLSDAEAEEKFGFLLEAFSYGPPPHGGIAFGFDRLVGLLAGTETIRDVIAFPKTTSAQDLMMSAPSPVDERQLAELGLALKRS